MSKGSAAPARKRQSSIIRVSLALLALLGIGLGVTTAVWTDNVWFTAAVSTKTFDLQGSVTSDSEGFAQSNDGSKIALIIPATVWADLEPSQSVTTKVWIKNAGTATAKLAAPVFSLSDATNELAIQTSGTATTGLKVTSDLSADTTLKAGDVEEVTVTIATGADLVEGGTGTLKINFAGSSLS